MKLNLHLNRTWRAVIGIVMLTFFFTGVSVSSAQIVSPEEYFGFQPGQDRMLFHYEDLIAYLQQLDAASDKLTMVKIGASPLGKPMYIAFISSGKNLQNLDRLKEINRSLALDGSLSEPARQKLLEEGRVFVLSTLSMHSGEVGPSQAAPLTVYELITSGQQEVKEWLDNVVLMLVPNHNPDGMDMVVDHYLKYKGTKYEGSSMPGVYHKYVGHDNNRDFVTLTQSDTRAIARIYNTDWYPQVMVEKHQMGSRGPRYFVPPMHDPIAENVDATVWNWTWVFGSNLVKDMTKAGLSGVSQHNLFDDYWPGSTETAIWKNVIGLLTECASANYASPIFVEPEELNVNGKGLSEYKKSINMSQPWPGGWWRLSDIVRYELESTRSLLRTAAVNRVEILRFRNDLCKKEIKKGQTEPPYYYHLPLEQHDRGELKELVDLLQEHGIQVSRLKEDILLDGIAARSGDIVIALAQPYRAFIKEVMENQKYPVRHYTPDGEIIKPYDITSWALPLHRGITSHEISKRNERLEKLLQPLPGDWNDQPAGPQNFWAAVFSVNENSSFKIAFKAKKLGLRVDRLTHITDFSGKKLPNGSFVLYFDPARKDQINNMLAGAATAPIFLTEKVKLDTRPVVLPRIALVETYFHDMDAGWTRYVFDEYNIPYSVVHPGEFKETKFARNFDVVIFPDADASILKEGKSKSDDHYYISSYPPEFTKGIADEGMEKLMEFLDKGGLILSWGRSSDLFLNTLKIKRGKKKFEEFQLPVRNVAKDLSKKGLYVPGSLLRIELKKDHPLTLGLTDQIGVFSRGRPVFVTTFPKFDMDRRIIASYPEENILMSGYAEQEKLLGRKSAVVWLKKGKGQLVLMGFNPQFRASTHASYKLMFNTLLLERLK